ncbi:MAG: hypothetical protein JXR83_16970 [Deltaproteobacteria bacterium]|nr:hypothetical protein [Deltaproteobacteria bacterium]
MVATRRACAPLVTAGRLVFALAIGISIGGARAQAAAERGGGRIYVLDLVDNGVGRDRAGLVTDMLRGEMAQAIGSRVVRPEMVAAILAQPEVAEQARCDRETYVECAVAVGQKISVSWVVTGTVAALGDAQLIDVRLVDVRARTESNRLQSPLSGSQEEDRTILHELGVRLAAPELWVGTLEVTGIQSGDKIMVDGAAVSTDPPLARVSLTVGSHALSVTRGDKPLLAQVVDIKYGETVALAVNALNSGGVSGSNVIEKTTFPMWPAWTASGVAVVAALVAIGFVVDYVLISSPRLEDAKEIAKAKQEPPCAIPGEPTWQCYIDDAQKNLNGDYAGIGIASGVGVVAAAAAGIMFYLSIGEEDGEASPGSLSLNP